MEMIGRSSFVSSINRPWLPVRKVSRTPPGSPLPATMAPCVLGCRDVRGKNMGKIGENVKEKLGERQ